METLKKSEPKINFVLTTSPNYAEVQQQILGAIQRHLDPGEYTQCYSRKVEGAYNFTLFVSQPADGLMSHGAADKNYFYRKDDKERRLADGLKDAFVPGHWLKRRLVAGKLHFDAEHVHAVGWPRLDLLLEMQRARPASPSPRKKVLWAPTHDFARRGKEKHSLSSYPEFTPFVAELEKDFDVSTSLHPRNRKDKQPTAEKLIEADYVISDFGTLVYEAWALGKPVIFPHWITGPPITEYLNKHTAEHQIFRERIGIHADSFEELRDILAAGPEIDRKTTVFAEDYLPASTRGQAGERTAETLRRLAAAL